MKFLKRLFRPIWQKIYNLFNEQPQYESRAYNNRNIRRSNRNSIERHRKIRKVSQNSSKLKGYNNLSIQIDNKQIRDSTISPLIKTQNLHQQTQNIKTLRSSEPKEQIQSSLKIKENMQQQVQKKQLKKFSKHSFDVSKDLKNYFPDDYEDFIYQNRRPLKSSPIQNNVSQNEFQDTKNQQINNSSFVSISNLQKKQRLPQRQAMTNFSIFKQESLAKDFQKNKLENIQENPNGSVQLNDITFQQSETNSRVTDQEDQTRSHKNTKNFINLKFFQSKDKIKESIQEQKNSQNSDEENQSLKVDSCQQQNSKEKQQQPEADECQQLDEKDDIQSQSQEDNKQESQNIEQEEIQTKAQDKNEEKPGHRNLQFFEKKLKQFNEKTNISSKEKFQAEFKSSKEIDKNKEKRQVLSIDNNNQKIQEQNELNEKEGKKASSFFDQNNQASQKKTSFFDSTPKSNQQESDNKSQQDQDQMMEENNKNKFEIKKSFFNNSNQDQQKSDDNTQDKSNQNTFFENSKSNNFFQDQKSQNFPTKSNNNNFFNNNQSVQQQTQQQEEPQPFARSQKFGQMNQNQKKFFDNSKNETAQNQNKNFQASNSQKFFSNRESQPNDFRNQRSQNSFFQSDKYENNSFGRSQNQGSFGRGFFGNQKQNTDQSQDFNPPRSKFFSGNQNNDRQSRFQEDNNFQQQYRRTFDGSQSYQNDDTRQSVFDRSKGRQTTGFFGNNNDNFQRENQYQRDTNRFQSNDFQRNNYRNQYRHSPKKLNINPIQLTHSKQEIRRLFESQQFQEFYDLVIQKKIEKQCFFATPQSEQFFLDMIDSKQTTVNHSNPFMSQMQQNNNSDEKIMSCLDLALTMTNKNDQIIGKTLQFDLDLYDRQNKLEQYFCKQFLKKAKKSSYVINNINILKIILAKNELDFEELKILYDKILNGIEFDLDLTLQRQMQEMDKLEFIKLQRMKQQPLSLALIFLNLFVDRLLVKYLQHKKIELERKDIEYLKSCIQVQIVLENTQDLKTFKFFMEYFYFNLMYKDTICYEKNIDLSEVFNIQFYDCTSEENFRTQQIKMIIQKFPDLLYYVNDIDGVSILGHSILSNDIQLLKTLKENLQIGKFKEDAVSPLMLAYQQENFEIFGLLIQKLLNINFNTEQNKKFLFNIVKQSKIDYLKMCLKKSFNLNMQMQNGKTLLHYACMYGDFEIVKLLLEHDADFTIKDKSNNSCIKYAEKGKFYDIVDYINDFYDCSYSNEELYDEYDDVIY